MLTKRRVGILIAILLAPTNSDAEDPVGHNIIVNKEFGISFSLPDKLDHCLAYSGDHLTGYYVSLDPKIHCRSKSYKSTKRFFSVIMSYNSNFSRSLYDVLPRGCKMIKPARLAKLRMPNFRIDGRPSVLCELKKPNHIVEIYAATRTGSWGDYFGKKSEEGKSQRVNFLFALGTVEAASARDIGIFSTVIRSVRFTDR